MTLTKTIRYQTGLILLKKGKQTGQLYIVLMDHYSNTCRCWKLEFLGKMQQFLDMLC